MRVLSSAFLYGNKVIPFEQPILSANGVIGGDSFAVCAYTIYGEELENAYKAVDGNPSTSLSVKGGGRHHLYYGIYNPYKLKLKARPTITATSGFSYTVYGTNDKEEFDDAIQTGNFHTITEIDFTNERGYYKYYCVDIDISDTTAIFNLSEIALSCAEKLRG